MSLTSISQQSLSQSGDKLYTVQLRYATNSNGRYASEFITKRNITQSQISSVQDTLFSHLEEVESKGILHSYTISIIPQLSYVRLESSEMFKSLESKLISESKLSRTYFPNLSNQLELLK